MQRTRGLEIAGKRAQGLGSVFPGPEPYSLKPMRLGKRKSLGKPESLGFRVRSYGAGPP